MNGLVKMMLSKAGSMYENWLARRSAEFRLPEDVEEFADVPYLDDGKECHRMDIYRPKGGSGDLPVIVNLHGGGLVLCKKSVNRPFCAELAKRGYLVFCVDYPLVPDVTVPQMLADVCTGINRVSELLRSYGGDPGRIYLVGDSAGAFLSVYAAAVQKDPAIARAASVSVPVPTIRGLGLINGMFHTAECDETGFFLRRDFYGRNWRKHPLLPYLKPERTEVASRMPPCFLITGKADKLRPSTIRFHRGLQRCRNHVQLLDFPRDNRLCHDFVIMYPQLEESRQAIDQMDAFFRQI